ncbi:MAG: efflux RND transporter periplasmic adaptor subunit [Verrucomicrobiota bacterium]
MTLPFRTMIRSGFSCLFLFTSSAVLAQEVLTYLEPYQSIEISPIETGTIDEIKVKEGEAVVKGQEMIRLDTEITAARLAIAETQAKAKGRIMVAEAQASLQQERYDRLRPLVSRGSSNQAELDKQAAALKEAQGALTIAHEEIRAAELQVKQIEAELKRRVLRSPIDGTVAEITKEIAEPVTASMFQTDSFLIRVVQLDKLKCVGHLPESSARGLKEGDTLTIRVDNKDRTEIEGVVEFVSPVINPATSTVRIRLIVDNEGSLLKGGSSAMILAPPRES